MLHDLPEPILIFICTLVAAKSLKDLLNMMRTSKVLNIACNDQQVLHSCDLNEIHFQPIPYDVEREKQRDGFLNQLHLHRNPKYVLGMV
jgi:hypothetical protein